MANDNMPRGLYPLNFNVQSAHYYRVSSATDIFLYQPVAIDSTGFVVGTATAGAAGLVVLGAAVGFAGPKRSGLACNDPFLDVSDITPPTGLETGDRYVLVADDPNQEFLVQEDTGGTALALADVGASADVIFRGAGGVVNGNADSGWVNLELDASSIVATLSGVVTILRLHDYVNTDGTENAVGDFAKWVVRITNHQKTGQQILAQV